MIAHLHHMIMTTACRGEVRQTADNCATPQCTQAVTAARFTHGRSNITPFYASTNAWGINGKRSEKSSRP
jgi:hypothetical protein